ncbi:uncharacterized protein LOC117646097 [Thrips palmi]|uniref:Uncharacterized protein LOC117646097 n=1 Tax=Thrips palmi TaxID=161013 RepID=A0A6P8YRN6_THRPL|nr:uncharacterized protein LOC117646097 [Thrips palmi]
MAVPNPLSNEHLGPGNEAPAANPSFQRSSSRNRISDEQIHSSACGSAIEINYDEESRPAVNPFNLEWAFGSRPGGQVLNLSHDGQGLVAYCNAHAVVLYDYKAHAQRLLLGHVSTVLSD